MSTCPKSVIPSPCNSLQYSENETEGTVLEGYVNESLNIGGASLLLYKLLGTHSQHDSQDITGLGTAISGGHLPGYDAANAFGPNGSFRSKQKGQEVLQTAYLGYDFGPLRLPNGRKRYGPETYNNVMVTSLALQVSNCHENNAGKIRVERSQNGREWFGVAVLDLTDDDGIQSFSFRSSAASRWWRIRPVTFNGGDNDSWEIGRLHMSQYEAPNIRSIQDKVLLENRDRDYSIEPITIKGKYDMMDSIAELNMHGIHLPETITLEVAFADVVNRLGRPPIIGDIIDLVPSAMFSAEMRLVKKYMEVHDVAWSSTGFTATWKPTLLKLTLVPAIVSRETAKLFGPLQSNQVDPSKLFDVDDGKYSDKHYQDYSEITQHIRAEAHNENPLDGISRNQFTEISDEMQAFADSVGLGANVRRLRSGNKGWFVEDGMPPNDEPYTEGPELPSVDTARDGDWHRLTYTGVAGDVSTRLYRFNIAKNRWVYKETDRRQEQRHFNEQAYKHRSETPVPTAPSPIFDKPGPVPTAPPIVSAPGVGSPVTPNTPTDPKRYLYESSQGATEHTVKHNLGTTSPSIQVRSITGAIMQFTADVIDENTVVVKLQSSSMVKIRVTK